ncbi:sigma-54 dependent transcriptional regulator [Opitutia bacterium ISCC 51]|nr:sigma-54 dependent transcriptional regulator [Opitutae bacterium ISCC 51]QXD27953.1 sigma-54 dependent transcriptional regulator [Opitutae bacterium ISCC 52]
MQVTLIPCANSEAYLAKLAAIGLTPYVEDSDHINDLQAENTEQVYFVSLETAQGENWADIRMRLAEGNRYYLVVGGDLSTEQVITFIRDGAFDVLDLRDTDNRWLSAVHEAVSSQDLWWQLYGGYSSSTNEDLLGQSAALQSLKQSASIIGPTNVSVLVLGESGAGKERVAQAIHNSSGKNSFVAVNCAAIPKDLIESELFGVKKGAYTGAVSSKKGLIQEADGGTLFLDEIGEMDIMLQPKLLRFLETRKARSLGSNEEYSVDLRVITATNRDLELEIPKGIFRADLYYRISEVILNIPPLRARVEDIPILAQSFLKMSVERFGKSFDSIEPELINRFQSYAWPGNVRELKQAIDRLVILNNGQILRSSWWEAPRRSHESLAMERAHAATVSQPTPQVAGYTADPFPLTTPAAAPQPAPVYNLPARDDISGYLQGAPPNKKDRYKHAKLLLEQSDNDYAWVASRMGIHLTTLYRWRKNNKV